MDDDARFQELKEKEIQRLIDEEGKANPIKGILTDDEILRYAGDSRTASEIRLKRGIGTQADKSRVHDDMYVGFFAVGLFVLFPLSISLMYDNLIGKILFFLVILLMIGYYIYVMYIKDYTEPEYKYVTQKEDKAVLETVEEKITYNDELLLLFESKEKIAREMIEKKFPAPQLTNSKFNGAIDNCKEIVESQIEVLNHITPTEKTKYEIESRKKLIKEVISKLDDLTNELILSEENNSEEVLEEMDSLINSVKEY